jgi:phage/plasmid-associated DNA primase
MLSENVALAPGVPGPFYAHLVQCTAGQDSVGLWLEECCEKKEDEWTANTLIMISYTNWCEANGYEPKKAKGLSQSLASHGYEVGAVKWVATEIGQKGKALRGIGNLRIL